MHNNNKKMFQEFKIQNQLRVTEINFKLQDRI